MAARNVQLARERQSLLVKNGLYTNFSFLGRVLRITCLRIRDFNDSALNLVKFNNIKGYNVPMVYSFAISGKSTSFIRKVQKVWPCLPETTLQQGKNSTV